MIKVETSTLRVWVVELQSIVFGKDRARYIRSMFGPKGEAKTMADALVAFAADQSVVVAATSAPDAEMIADIAPLSTSLHGAVSRVVLAAVLPRSDSPGDEQPEAGGRGARIVTEFAAASRHGRPDS